MYDLVNIQRKELYIVFCVFYYETSENMFLCCELAINFYKRGVP